VIPLRPLGLGEILDGAITTMRAYPKLMLGVSAVVVAISQVLIVLATYPWLDDLNRAATIDETTSPGEVGALLGGTLAVIGIGLAIVLVSRVFLTGFITLVVGKAVLGQPATFGEVWARVRPRLLPLLGLTLLYPLAGMALLVPVALLGLAAPPVAVLAYIVVAAWLYVLFSLASPAFVLEDARVGRAFARSRQLVRGSWWRVFGILLLAAVIAFVISLIIGVPFELAAGGLDQVTSAEPVAPTGRYLVVTTIGAIIASTITEPFVVAVTVLLYTDQRMRREGMDIELARMAGGSPM
jgi:hypothetical protein